MLEQLFGSKTRLKLLKVFFREPEAKFFVRELTRLVGSQINSVRREIQLLNKAGLLLEVKNEDEEKAGSRSSLKKYYRLNIESILYPELEALLAKDQLLGQQKFIEDVKEKAGSLKLLILTGRFTGDKRAPSDMLIVSDNAKESALEKLVKKYEKEIGAELNYTILSHNEFQDRRHVMDKFLFSLFEAKNIKVIDKLGA